MKSLFRDLTDQEIKEFRQWARDNYAIGSAISDVWHPVVRDECHKINDEHLTETINALQRESDS